MSGGRGFNDLIAEAALAIHEEDKLLVQHPTEDELWARVVTLEARAGKSTAELREARKTWDMTVEQRDCLDEIEGAKFLLEGASDVEG